MQGKTRRCSNSVAVMVHTCASQHGCVPHPRDGDHPLRRRRGHLRSLPCVVQGRCHGQRHRAFHHLLGGALWEWRRVQTPLLHAVFGFARANFGILWHVSASVEQVSIAIIVSLSGRTGILEHLGVGSSSMGCCLASRGRNHGSYSYMN